MKGAPSERPDEFPVIWFTGLSGAGKTTLSTAVGKELAARGWPVSIIDGDVLRSTSSADLGFSRGGRKEQIHRAVELALGKRARGDLVIVALISPFRADREWMHARIGRSNLIEIYCSCPLEVCEARDVKGLYRKARRGEVQEFTGVSSPYEPPEDADLSIDISFESPAESTRKILDFLSHLRGHIEPPPL